MIRDMAYENAILTQENPNYTFTELVEKNIADLTDSIYNSTSYSNSIYGPVPYEVPIYDKYVYGNPTIHYKNATGYAGSQSVTGAYLNSGDGMYHSLSGGPNYAISLSVGGFGISFNVPLGIAGGSVGKFYKANSAGRYKIYSNLKYQITTREVLGHPYGSPAGTLVSLPPTYSKLFYADNSYLKKM